MWTIEPLTRDMEKINAVLLANDNSKEVKGLSTSLQKEIASIKSCMLYENDQFKTYLRVKLEPVLAKADKLVKDTKMWHLLVAAFALHSKLGSLNSSRLNKRRDEWLKKATSETKGEKKGEDTKINHIAPQFIEEVMSWKAGQDV